MFDTIGKVACPTCKTVTSFSFVLALRGSPYLVSLAACKRCVQAGDNRSIQATAKVDQVTWYSAVFMGLPVVATKS